MTKDWQSELQTSVLRGMNSGRSPGLIDTDQIFLGHNVSTRGGRIRGRSRWVRRLTLIDGRPQGFSIFEKTSEILASVEGYILKVDPSDWSIVIMHDSTEQNFPDDNYAYFQETEGSLIIQNGRAWPWVYDGSEFRRFTADDGDSLPIGKAMSYANGRLAVATGSQHTLAIGNIVDQAIHQSELIFTEINAGVGGGSFTFPDRIIGMTHIPILDTATGFGSLIIGLRKRTFSMRTEVTQRIAWPSTPGFQTVIFNGHGITGHIAHAQVNQDVFFRSLDGLRSLRATVSDYQSAGSTPVSREMASRVDFDTEWMLEAISCAYFDNRLFVTHSPYLLENVRPVHVGVFSLNFDLLSEMGAKAPAAFDGEWEGPPIVQIAAGDINGERRMFALCVEGGRNTIWEMLPDRRIRLIDALGRYPEDNRTHVIETRVYYGQDPRVLKRLRKVRFWFTDIRGFIHFNVYFRAEGTDEWTFLDDFKFNVDLGDIYNPTAPGSREEISTRTVSDAIDSVRQRALNVGHGFQLRFEWCGDMRIDTWEVLTEPIAPSIPADNPTEATDLSAINCEQELPDPPTVPFPLPGNEFNGTQVYESYAGSSQKFGITEFGDLSSPPKKYRRSFFDGPNQLNRTISPDSVGTETNFHVAFNTSGTETDQFVVDGVIGSLVFDFVDSFEDFVYNVTGKATFSGLLNSNPPTWIRNKRSKEIDPDNFGTLAPGESTPYFQYRPHTSGTLITLELTRPAWDGSKWQTTVTISGLQQAIGSYTITLKAAIAPGNQAPVDPSTGQTVLTLNVPPGASASSANVVLDLPSDCSLRLHAIRSNSPFSEYTWPEIEDTTAAMNEAGVDHWLYLPDGSSYSMGQKLGDFYAERLGLEDTDADAMARGTFTLGTEEVAIGTTITGGITAGSPSPINITGTAIILHQTFGDSLAEEALTVGRRYRWTITFETSNNEFFTKSEHTEQGTFDATSTEETVDFYFFAPAGYKRRVKDVVLVDIGATPAYLDPEAPVIYSDDSLTDDFGASISFQVLAWNSPTSYGATGLPSGLSINTSTGEITGTVTQSGVFPVAITATNAQGTGQQAFTMTINAPPAIPSSSLDASYFNAVYGLRPIINGYLGNLFDLRRDSDDSTMTFAVGYTIEDVIAFLAGATGYFTAIYDQSGNGQDVTKGGTTNQIKFDLVGPGSLPAMVNSTSIQGYLARSSTLASREVIAIARVTGGAFNGGLVCNSVNESLEIRKNNTNWDTYNYTSNIEVNNVSTVAIPIGTWAMHRFIRGSDATFANSHVIFNAQISLNRYLNAEMTELLFLNATGATNVSTIKSELNSIWSLY